MKPLYIIFLYLYSISLVSQVTIKITSIPSNTPLNSTLYFASNINGWNPGDSNFTFTQDNFGNYSITIPQSVGTVQYKITRGSWATVEGSATGTAIANRTFTFTNTAQTININVLSWEDLGPVSPNSTAAWNVSVLSPIFFIPQLNRNRRIWIYLPPDYNTSTKNYPVLYMQDGQNLFDNATSFSGEWQIDETLNTLFSQGDYGTIVVGIDNGGAQRLNEYSPWVNTQYGGGQGDAYVEFLANTLKPYIDANFRTLPQPEFNALIGSSMGALIATYGVCEHPDVFRKLGSFSPAYWFSLSNLSNYIDNLNTSLSSHRAYFVAGTNESSSMVTNTNIIKNKMNERGMTSTNTFTKYDNYGTHSEAYWRGEFATAYQWLFQNEILSNTDFYSSAQANWFQVNDKIYVENIENDYLNSTLFTLDGKAILEIKLVEGKNYLPDFLQSGLYILKCNNKNIKTLKIVKD